DREFLLGNASMRAQPTAQQRPESFHGIHMHFTHAVAIFIARELASSMVDALMVVSPRPQADINAGSCTSSVRLIRHLHIEYNTPSSSPVRGGGVAMVSDLFFYQLGLIALVWLCCLLHWVWPSDRPTVPAPLVQPTPPRPKRHREPKPFAGLTTRPHC